MHVHTLYSTGMSCFVTYAHRNSTDLVVVFAPESKLPQGWDVALVSAVNTEGCDMGYRLNSSTFRMM